jgi:hypothetical protein
VVSVLRANKRDSATFVCSTGVERMPPWNPTSAITADIRVFIFRRWICAGALEGIYDKDGSLDKISELNGYDDGNSYKSVVVDS